MELDLAKLNVKCVQRECGLPMRYTHSSCLTSHYECARGHVRHFSSHKGGAKDARFRAGEGDEWLSFVAGGLLVGIGAWGDSPTAIAAAAAAWAFSTMSRPESVHGAENWSSVFWSILPPVFGLTFVFSFLDVLREAGLFNAVTAYLTSADVVDRAQTGHPGYVFLAAS